MKTARDICLEAMGQAVAKHAGTQSTQQIVESMAQQKIASVSKLQASVLTPAQLDALAHVQDAIETIAKLQQSVNQLCTLHSLNVRRIGLFELGMLTKEIEDLVFTSQLTEARLRAGGISADPVGHQVRSTAAVAQRLVA